MPGTETIIGYVIAAGIVGTVAMLWRLSVQMASLATSVKSIARDVAQHEIRLNDLDRRQK